MERCLDCKKLMSDKRRNRCRNCYIKHHSYRYNSVNKIYHCEECNDIITYRSAVRNNFLHLLCKSCSHKGKRSYLFKGGKPLCIECGKELSTRGTKSYKPKRCSSCSKIGNRNVNFGKPPKHGKHITYKNILFRSSYEFAYAKYLDANGIKWLYESKTFDLGNTTYTPDFYLPATDEYIEIKGYWRNGSEKKFGHFLKKYPKIKISIYYKSDLIKKNILTRR